MKLIKQNDEKQFKEIGRRNLRNVEGLEDFINQNEKRGVFDSICISERCIAVFD